MKNRKKRIYFIINMKSNETNVTERPKKKT